MSAPEILILGAGLMGRVAAYFFVNHPQGKRAVTLVDADRANLDDSAAWLNSPLIHAKNVDVADSKSLREVVKGHKVCLSCVPYFLGPNIAKICLEERVSYLDLGGNPEVTDEILSMSEKAKRAGIAMIPDTGLAPGLTNILATELVSRFKKCDSAHIRVGGLPQDPKGPLKYAQFFSVYGLLNEYLEVAREIRDGVVVEIPSLTDVESLRFDTIGDLEAFITSGGTSTLPKTLAGKVNRLSYKTIRFPGHCAALSLLREIGLTDTTTFSFGEIELSPRQMLATVLDNYLPKHVPDMVLVRVTASGDGGREEKIEFVAKHDTKNKISAMGQTTSFPAAAIALAIATGIVPPGAHPQESVIPYAWMKEQLGLFGIEI
jgi:lysine 6-dehydrogenase